MAFKNIQQNVDFGNIALAQRFTLVPSTSQALGKPTAVSIGAYSGFSMPIYNSDNEELFFGITAPRRWDGTTNPIVYVLCHLGNTEDVGDKFKYQLSYVGKAYASGVISTATTDVTTETTVATGRAAQYDSYVVSFTLDATKLCAGCLLDARLRRIAASGSEVSNEVIVTDAYINFKRDKIGVAWS
jgi:hypothetical protein